MVKQIPGKKRGRKSQFRLVQRPDLVFGGSKLIANHVVAVILDTSVDDKDAESVIIEDFTQFLVQNSLEKKFGNCFEISPTCTIDANAVACIGARFDFYRLLSGKDRKDEDLSMGSGTQWVSDVVMLMKDFLLFLREKYRDDSSEGYAEYSDARLIIREDDKQIEWR